jgi:hypothetical protein
LYQQVIFNDLDWESGLDSPSSQVAVGVA